MLFAAVLAAWITSYARPSALLIEAGRARLLLFMWDGSLVADVGRYPAAMERPRWLSITITSRDARAPETHHSLIGHGYGFTPKETALQETMLMIYITRFQVIRSAGSDVQFAGQLRDARMAINVVQASAHRIKLHCWSPALLTAVLPLLWLHRRRVFRSRLSAGRCRFCGYDLRATPQRCPECGNDAAT